MAIVIPATVAVDSDVVVVVMKQAMPMVANAAAWMVSSLTAFHEGRGKSLIPLVRGAPSSPFEVESYLLIYVDLDM